MVTGRLLASAAVALAVSCISAMAASAAWVDPPPFEPPQAARPVQPAPPPAAAQRPSAPPVDKPADSQPPPPPAEAPPPQAPRSAAAPTEDPSGTGQRVAEQLFVDYLRYWSGVSVVSVEDVSRYYSFPLVFYGRRILSPDEVVAEKQRFIGRWPERDYVAVPGTLRSICDSERSVCHVSGLFTFSAIDPQRGRASTGTGHLELDVSLDGASPKIISENSKVVSRERQQEDNGDEF